MFYVRSFEQEDILKKFGYILAALATFVIAVPSIVSAQTVVIKRGGGGGGFNNDRGRGRGGGFRGRGRGQGNKVVIIKKRSRY